ncbi:hypothetical protein SAY86_014239 [Trapa natans]|uniref:LysM domain-containing protein n=1 Tax=Trapa natans TaxID=22666 RepID=A0AAN7KTT6_TRANT|nr:hypothetical protein SAY86_014239 [Trapa natans]
MGVFATVGSSGLLFLVGAVVVVMALGPTSTAALGFSCSNSTAAATCRGIVGYKSPNQTTYPAVQALFGVTDLLSILGANGLPESTPATAPVSKGQVINIPFTCSCSNGTGTSQGIPIYTVQPGNTLTYIASEVFSNLVTYGSIATASNISNPDLILAGDKLKIPLPCSCDSVDGERVVHYGHVVAAGSSVEMIGQQFNVSADVLLRLNNLTSDKDLLANATIDVPLKACSSVIRNDSLDSSFLVPNLPNAAYFLTANNCVKCSCSSANNYTLQCQPSQIAPSNWTTCPSMQCQGTSHYIGNSTGSSCCNYAGYTNQTILTSSDTCPVTDNYAAKINTGAFSWNTVVTLLMVTLSLHHFHNLPTVFRVF